jgi:O-antigen/teichoic acid export membrane protein
LQQLGLCALAVSGLLIAAGAFSLGIGPAGIAPVMWTLSAVLAFIMLREFVRRLCLANLRMATAFAFDVVVSSLQLAAVLLLAHWGKLSASRALCVIGLACGLAALTWLASNRKLFRVRRDRAVEHLRQNWGLAKWVAATAVLWSLSMNFYPWIITAFKGTAETGAFAACFGVVSAGTMLLLGVQNYLGPKIATVYAQSGADAMHRFVVRISLALCLPLIPFCVALGWFGDPLLQWIYGAQYAGNGAIITILSLNLLALALAFSFSRALFAVERADIDFKVNCAAFLVLLTFGIWMVRAHGAWGAAWGLLAANTVAGAFRYGAFVHVIRSQREARAI